MKIEATGNSFIYRWPGGSVTLEPGKPIELEDERAKRLLKKAGAKARQVPRFEVGDVLTWERADGSHPVGTLSFAHVDLAGVAWGFVDLPDGTWAAVPLTRASKVTPQGKD